MLLTFLLTLIIAISLPYFSLSSVESKKFWERISIIAIVISLFIYNETIILDTPNTFSLYNGLFNYTLTNSTFIGLILFSSLILNFIGSSYSNSFINLTSELSDSNLLSLDTRNRERLVFVFSLIVGGIILSGASDFLTVFLGLELQSYSAYVLAASYRNYEPSEAAGLKYFLLGALSSALIFMGLALLYVYSGNTQIDLSFLILASSNLSDIFDISTMVPYIGAILILIGFFWKIAAAPLQAWSIDVYDAVPTRTTAILSLLPKIGLISFITSMIYSVSLVNFTSVFQTFNLNIFNINYVIYIIISLSLIIGSIYGIFQPRTKRLLAYSSVLNIGFILMGATLINFGQFDSFNPLFYLIQYILTTGTIWLGLTLLEKVTGTEITLNSQLQGLANHSLYGGKRINQYINIKIVFIAVSLTVLILSTAGIPPMIGFFAKYEIILLSLKTEYYSLAILAIVASLLSTYYYLNIVKNIWFKTVLNNQESQLISLSTRTLNAHSNNQNLSQVYPADMAGETRHNIKRNFMLGDYLGNGSFITLLTLTIALFVVQYSVVYIFLTLNF